MGRFRTQLGQSVGGGSNLVAVYIIREVAIQFWKACRRRVACTFVLIPLPIVNQV